MKNLENKYIDLANFYKQELVKNSKKSIEDEREKHGSYPTGHQFRQGNNLSPTRSYEKNSPGDHIDQSVRLSESLNFNFFTAWKGFTWQRRLGSS